MDLDILPDECIIRIMSYIHAELYLMLFWIKPFNKHIWAYIKSMYTIPDSQKLNTMIILGLRSVGRHMVFKCNFIDQIKKPHYFAPCRKFIDKLFESYKIGYYHAYYTHNCSYDNDGYCKYLCNIYDIAIKYDYVKIIPILVELSIPYGNSKITQNILSIHIESHRSRGEACFDFFTKNVEFLKKIHEYACPLKGLCCEIALDFGSFATVKFLYSIGCRMRPNLHKKYYKLLSLSD